MTKRKLTEFKGKNPYKCIAIPEWETKKKGGNITYVRIDMAEYLHPVCKLSTEQKQQLFAIRIMMVDLPEHFLIRQYRNLVYLRRKRSHVPHLLLQNTEQR